MIATFIVKDSKVPTKIGTIATRDFDLGVGENVVEENGVPTFEIDGHQSVSIDRKSVQATTVAVYERISVTYVFPLSELDLDNEFRLSAAPYGQEVDLDMSSYEWIDRVLKVVLDIEPVSTEKVGCTHYRRSFNALVVG